MYHKFNLTEIQYEQLLKQQNSVCAICGKPETKRDRTNRVQPLSVDHNHKTFKVRGLLCQKCNQGLGNFEDDSKLLEKAIKYLENNKETLNE